MSCEVSILRDFGRERALLHEASQSIVCFAGLNKAQCQKTNTLALLARVCHFDSSNSLLTNLHPRFSGGL